MRADFVAADAARTQRIERLSFEADLAAHRSGNVDAANRLVAAQSETAWNTSLRALHEAQRGRERHREACEQGTMTAAEMAERLGKIVWTVAEYARQGHILREDIRTGERITAVHKLPPDGTERRSEKDTSKPAEYIRGTPHGTALAAAERLATHRSSDGTHREPSASRQLAHDSWRSMNPLLPCSKGLSPSSHSQLDWLFILRRDSSRNWSYGDFVDDRDSPSQSEESLRHRGSLSNNRNWKQQAHDRMRSGRSPIRGGREERR